MSVEDAAKRVAFCMASYKGPGPEMVGPLARMFFAFGRRRDWEFAPFILGRKQCHVACNDALSAMEDAEQLLGRGQKFTHVMYMDDDVYMTPDNAVRLIEAVDKDHPVVFALAFYRQWPHRPSLYAYAKWHGLDTELHPCNDYPPNEMFRVNAAGLCAAAFDRDIFRLIKKPYFDWFEGGYNHPAMTPDGFLCYRFLEAGIPIHVHTGIGCTHVGFPDEIDEAKAVQFRDKWRC